LQVDVDRRRFRFEVLRNVIPYTGRELRSGWVKDQTGLDGDAAVGFVGPCRVENEDLVDLDDARSGEFIAAGSMAHVIIEHPSCDLETAVLRQRILVCLLCEILAGGSVAVRRSGDDVFYDGRKLTVSIAAPGPDCALVHLGINVDPVGAPVPAVGLAEMKVEPVGLLVELLDRYRREIESARYATQKVRKVP
jgi:hypothetical protein